MQQVEEEKLRDKEYFKNKRANTGMSLGSKRIMPAGHSSNRNRRFLLHPSASAPVPKNKGEYFGLNSIFKPAYS